MDQPTVSLNTNDCQSPHFLYKIKHTFFFFYYENLEPVTDPPETLSPHLGTSHLVSAAPSSSFVDTFCPI